MKVVSLTYTINRQHSDPTVWVKKIWPYLGILEQLSKLHRVWRLEQINYGGNYTLNGIQFYFHKPASQHKLFPLGLNRLVKQIDPDLVIVHGFNSPWPVIQLRMLLGKRAKIVLQYHGGHTPRGWRKGLFRLADACISAYLYTAAEQATTWIDSRQVCDAKKLIEMMPASSVFSEMNQYIARQHSAVTGSPAFLWVGRLNKNKDPLTVIQAFRLVVAVNPKAKLYMVYQTSELLSAVQTSIGIYGLQDVVHMVPDLPHHDLLYWYNSFDFFICSSFKESFGLALCEAMSCGCIPLASNIPSFRKIAGDCGLFFEAGDAGGLYDVMKKAVDMPIAEAKQKVLLRFKVELSFEAIARRLHEVFAEEQN